MKLKHFIKFLGSGGSVGRVLMALLIMLPLCREPLIHAEVKVDIGSLQVQRKVSGEVTDPAGEPLPGVNVLEKGTSNGVVTDVDGRFEISLQGSNPVLLFSYIGFISSEVSVGNRAVISLRMEEDINRMDEIVVIGYGSTTKKEVTGSIASLKQENFVKGNISDPLQLLQGQIAGMTIVKPDGGDPNGGFSVQLRGMTSLSGARRLWLLSTEW